MEGDYVFFYSHNPAKYLPGESYKASFSNWYVGSVFRMIREGLPYDLYGDKGSFDMVDGETYKSVEKWMMLGKARMFGDKDAEAKILATEDPREIKAVGRTVRNFDSEKWTSIAYRHVVNGIYLKFTQDYSLYANLVSTFGKTIVEATDGSDKIWGIGFLAGTKEEIEVCMRNRNEWGSNLLGKALTEIRDKLVKKSSRESYHPTTFKAVVDNAGSEDEAIRVLQKYEIDSQIKRWTQFPLPVDVQIKLFMERTGEDRANAMDHLGVTEGDVDEAVKIFESGTFPGCD